jgi:hypothetical protein
MMVAKRTRTWAWVTVLSLVLAAVSPTFDRFSSARTAVLLTGVAISFLAIFNTYRAVADDETLSAEDTEKLQSSTERIPATR